MLCHMMYLYSQELEALRAAAAELQLLLSEADNRALALESDVNSRQQQWMQVYTVLRALK